MNTNRKWETKPKEKTSVSDSERKVFRLHQFPRLFRGTGAMLSVSHRADYYRLLSCLARFVTQLCCRLTPCTRRAFMAQRLCVRLPIVQSRISERYLLSPGTIYLSDSASETLASAYCQRT